MQPGPSEPQIHAELPLAYRSRPLEPLPPLPSSSSLGSLTGTGSFRDAERGDRFFIFGTGAPPVRTNRRAEPFRGQGADRWRPSNFRDGPPAAAAAVARPPPVLGFNEVEAACYCCSTFVRYQRASPAFTCAVCGTVCDLVRPARRRPRARVPSDDELREMIDQDERGQSQELSSLLAGIFDEVGTVSAAFRAPAEAEAGRPRAFFAAFEARPRARRRLVEAVQRLLKRPGFSWTEQDVDWAIVLLQSPIATWHIEASERTVMLSRLFGLSVPSL